MQHRIAHCIISQVIRYLLNQIRSAFVLKRHPLEREKNPTYGNFHLNRTINDQFFWFNNNKPSTLKFMFKSVQNFKLIFKIPPHKSVLQRKLFPSTPTVSSVQLSISLSSRTSMISFIHLPDSNHVFDKMGIDKKKISLTYLI
jgi:hypothetical protein